MIKIKMKSKGICLRRPMDAHSGLGLELLSQKLFGKLMSQKVPLCTGYSSLDALKPFKASPWSWRFGQFQIALGGFSIRRSDTTSNAQMPSVAQRRYLLPPTCSLTSKLLSFKPITFGVSVPLIIFFNSSSRLHGSSFWSFRSFWRWARMEEGCLNILLHRRNLGLK